MLQNLVYLLSNENDLDLAKFIPSNAKILMNDRCSPRYLLPMILVSRSFRENKSIDIDWRSEPEGLEQTRTNPW
jgi:hypothetical protein